MITTLKTDIFETVPKKVVIVHQANCFNTLARRTSSGIARLIEQKYPEACEADAKTVEGDRGKLGTLSIAKCADGRIIVNMYSQFECGGKRATNYEALATGFETLRDRLNKYVEDGSNDVMLAIPYGLGSVLGGGSWQVVRALIDSIFTEAKFDVVICRLPGQQDLV